MKIISKLCAAIAMAAAYFGLLKGPRLLAVNFGDGTHVDSISLLSDEAVGTKNLLMTAAAASDTNHFAICAADEEPIGFCPDEVVTADIGEARTIHLLGRGQTRRGVVSEAVSKGEFAYTAAAGKLQNEPGSAGTYWRVGRFLTAGTGDGDTVEVETMFPVKLVVIAAFSSVNGAAASAADLAALKTVTETLGDDLRSLGAAAATPALVKVLAS